MKILLAEDDVMLRETFVRQLLRHKHEVSAFEDGSLLCNAMREGVTADLVWTDLAMPVGDGFSVIRAARANLPGVPVLVVSGHGDVDHLRSALRLGVDHFLPKPFDLAELHAVLRRVEAMHVANRDRACAWQSFTRCEIEMQIPPDMGVAAATAVLFSEHARSFLDEDGCRSMQTAMHEILLNAIEHGCMEITHQEKLDALAEDVYAELLAERQSCFHDRRVTARILADPCNGVTVTITDPGPGFDPSLLPDPSDPDNLFLPSGRGIILAKLQVDDLRYENGGRTVILKSHRKPALEV